MVTTEKRENEEKEKETSLTLKATPRQLIMKKA